MELSGLTQILEIPSPLVQIKPSWLEGKNAELWVKRDELIHPYISGNKWRKLKGILESQKTIASIRTFGGPWSNHIVATAASCYALRLPCTIYIRGEGPYPENRVLQICREHGANLEFLGRAGYDQMKREFGHSEGVLTIPEGGYCMEGTFGAGEVIDEMEVVFDKMVLACGTGTFSAGVSATIDAKQLPTQVIGVPALKGGSFLYDDIKRLGGGTPELWTDYHFGGYAKTNDELFQFTEKHLEETGILLDPIYTSKAMFGLRDQMEKYPGAFDGKRICFIHTGGLTGWYGRKESRMKSLALGWMSEHFNLA